MKLNKALETFGNIVQVMIEVEGMKAFNQQSKLGYYTEEHFQDKAAEVQGYVQDIQPDNTLSAKESLISTCPCKNFIAHNPYKEDCSAGNCSTWMRETGLPCLLDKQDVANMPQYTSINRIRSLNEQNCVKTEG